MDIRLTWDLFVLVFFGIIVAYSFIIGRSMTMKVILGTYAAALAADATGNLFAIYFGDASGVLRIASDAGINGAQDIAIILKVVLFIFLVIVLTVRGGFEVDAKRSNSVIGHIIMTGFFGFLSAGLIVGTVMMYISGLSFIAGGFGATSSSILTFTGQSPFIENILKYYNFWFMLPVAGLIFGGFLVGSHDE